MALAAELAPLRVDWRETDPDKVKAQEVIRPLWEARVVAGTGGGSFVGAAPVFLHPNGHFPAPAFWRSILSQWDSEPNVMLWEECHLAGGHQLKG